MTGRYSKVFWIASLTLAMTLMLPTSAAWYNSGWTYRLPIVVSSSYVNGDQANFPIYVDLADLSNTNFFAAVRSDGADIRVTKSDGSSEVAREIVAIDTANGTGEMHFVANGTLSGSSNTSFYIYYGNGNAANYDNGDTYGSDKVWVNNYVGVWHLNQDPDGGAGSILDSTLYDNHANPQNMAGDDPVTGVLGKALDFDGTNEAVVVPSTTDHNVINMTISAWAKQDTQANYMEVAGRWGTSDNLFTMLTQTGTGGPRFWVTALSGSQVASDGVARATGIWRHYVGTYNGEEVISYLNSDQVAANATPSGNLDTGTQDLQIGYRVDATNYPFDGQIDEVRMASVARTNAWIDTAFNNQNGTTNFYSVGGEEQECATSSWYNSGWSRRTKITLQSTQINGFLLRNLPIYVDLSHFANYFFTNVRSDGADIRVTKCDGSTEVAREVVAIDIANGTGEMYFVANGAISSQSDISFYIYYGNGDAAEPGAASTYGSEKVWDSNYVGVWHMNEDPNGDANDAIKDSTSSANHGTPNGTMLSSDLVAGKLGKAIDLDGADDFIDMGSTSLGITDTLTVSFWANFDTLTASTYYTPFSLGGYISDGFLLQRSGAGGHALRFASEASVVVDGAGLTTTGQWFNCAATLNSGTSYVVYLNANGTASTAGGTSIVDPKDLEIGRRADNTSQYADAKIDEVRISKVARSSNWIRSQYNNHHAPNTFYSLEEDYANGWTASTKITIKASLVNGDLSNFPVYVNLSHLPSSFFTTVNGSGADIRVTNGNQMTQLPFELVSLDTNNGSGELWFKADFLSGSSNTDFYIHYGSAGAVMPPPASLYGSQKVWTNAYRGAWHMQEDPNGDPSNAIKDSTANTNHGTPSGSMTSADSVPGVAGNAIDFDGTNDYILLGLPPSLNIGKSTMTLDLWVYSPELTASGNDILINNEISYEFGVDTSNRAVQAAINTVHPSAWSWGGSSTMSLSNWEKLTLVVDGTNWSFYKDGSHAQTIAATGSQTGTIEDGSNDVRIGARQSGGHYWKGILEEVRISDVVRSGGWIKTEFNNLFKPEDFYLINDQIPLDASWSNKSKITIQTAQINGDLSSFPVYVDLSDMPESFFTNVRSDGGDIRVTNGNQMTQMPVELVNLDTANGSGELWFRADFLSSTANTNFWIFYNNSGASTPPASSNYGSYNVWSNGYVAVYHMNEDPAGGTDSILDSTSNANHGTPGGSMNSADLVNGQMANAIDFDGSNDYIGIGNVSAMNFTTGPFSIAAWVKATAAQGRAGIIEKRSGAGVGWRLKYGSSNNGNASLYDGSSDVNPNTPSDIQDNNWHQLVGTYQINAGNWDLALFLDGSSVSTATGSSGNSVSNANSVQVGVDNNAHYLSGSIDEIQVSNVVRSANWVSAAYNNQNTPKTFYKIGGGGLFDWQLF